MQLLIILVDLQLLSNISNIQIDINININIKTIASVHDQKHKIAKPTSILNFPQKRGPLLPLNAGKIPRILRRCIILTLESLNFAKQMDRIIHKHAPNQKINLLQRHTQISQVTLQCLRQQKTRSIINRTNVFSVLQKVE